jgi:hypothetical protein
LGYKLKKGKKWLKHQADLGYSKKTLGRNPNNIARYLYAIYICIICIIIYICVFSVLELHFQVPANLQTYPNNVEPFLGF